MTLFKNTIHFEIKKGDYIVLLHGIARSSRHMRSLGKFLEEEGYEVINLDYPSTRYSLEELVEIVNNYLSAQLTKDKKVHFVGYSMGGILARALINKHRPEKLGCVIQLAPPNQGSEVADFLKDRYIYQKFYGPAGQELTTGNTNTAKLLGEINYELGVIAGNSTIDPISSFLIIKGDNDGKVSVERTKVDGMKDHIVVSASHTFFPKNKYVKQQVVSFLNNRKFEKE